MSRDMPGGGPARTVSTMKGRAPRIHQAVNVPTRTWPEVRELMLETINREISHLSLTAAKRKLTIAESLQMTRMSVSLARLAPAAQGKGQPPPVEDLGDEELAKLAGSPR